MEEIAAQRLQICKTCPHHSTNAKSKGYKTRRLDDHCTHCGCPLATKTRALQKGCPINNWPAILSDQEQAELNKIKSSQLTNQDDSNKEHNTEGSNRSTELNA